MYFKFISFLFLGSMLNALISNGAPVTILQNTPIHSPDDTFRLNRPLVINEIILSGNKVTKPQIIFRELLFKTGDTLTSESLSQILEQSRKNLLNTSLFNFVTIDTTSAASGKINITIALIERWYIWPMPFFQLSERNFNVWWKTKDLSRVDYGLYLTWENFRGRKESLVLLLRMGYNQTFGLSYKIPYINKSKTLGLGLTGGFSGNHEVAYKTDANEQVYYKDIDNFVQKNTFGVVTFSYRKSIFNTHAFQMNYDDYAFTDTLHELNPNFANKNHQHFLSFHYLFRSDHRDIKAYPLKGYYFDLELVKHGFGILKDENIDIAYVRSSVRKYWTLHKRWYLAGGLLAKASSKSFQPYFMQRGLGFGNDFVRSYEYYVVDGQDYALLKSNLKYELIRPRVKDFKFIPTKKFGMLHYAVYLNLLADAAYVNDRQTSGNKTLTNSLLGGVGVGLDLVTYYDKVWRFEYSVNKMGESGFFMHFVAPI